MTEQNDLETVLDTDGNDRKFTVTDLIHDEIADRLHHNPDLAGELHRFRMPDDETVLFEFADGRTITVHVEISSTAAQ